MKRAWSIKNILDKKYNIVPFTDAWKEAFGEPEARGVWFIFGESGSGKGDFVMQLCRFLAMYVGKGAYNSLEESDSKTMQDTIARNGMSDVAKQMVFFKMPMETCSDWLAKRKGIKYLVIDSFQYTQYTFNQWLDFKEKHPNVLIIVVSQCDGKIPRTSAARRVMSDADLKIWVEGYRAHIKGRYIGKKGYYTIWQKGADAYWGTEAA